MYSGSWKFVSLDFKLKHDPILIEFLKLDKGNLINQMRQKLHSFIYLLCKY